MGKAFTALAVACFIFLGALMAAHAESGVVPHPLKGKIVVVDAGHGGIDAGSTGATTGVREDTLNLSVAQELERLLEDAGAVVIMTREDEGGLYDADTKGSLQKREDMQRRAEIIETSGADLVVSIHMNSYTRSSPWGAQVLYQEGSEAGKRLADAIQEALVTGLADGNRRSAACGDYMVLRCSPAPAALVECGFLSNPAEEAKLVDENYRMLLAWYIYTGLMRYLAQSAAREAGAP